MQLRPLTRLRLAFVLLGAVLLTPLGFLLNAVDDRIQAQRRLRHDVVAERIFDELERELTAVLESESARPSSAYAEPTRIEAWAPFVVGYFRLGLAGEGPDLLARDQLDETRTRRLTDVLAVFAQAKKGAPGKNVVAVPSVVPAVDPARPRSFTPKSSPDVLQKLNRSQEERSRRNPPPQGSDLKRTDPMYGF